MATFPVLIVGEAGTGKRHVARTIHQNRPGRISHSFRSTRKPFRLRFSSGSCWNPQGRRFEKRSTSRRPRPSAKPQLALVEGSTLLIREIFSFPRDLQARLAAHARFLGPTDRDHRPRTRDRACQRAGPSRTCISPSPTSSFVCVRCASGATNYRFWPGTSSKRQSTRQRERGVLRPRRWRQLLREYDWPGNFSELAAGPSTTPIRSVKAIKPRLPVEDLPASIRGNLGAAYLPPAGQSVFKPLDQILAQAELESIEPPLRHARGNKSRAADLLGISQGRASTAGSRSSICRTPPRRTPRADSTASAPRGKTERAPSHPCSGAFRRFPFFA